MIARGGSGRSCFGWKASAWPGELRPWSPRDLSGSCCPPWPCRRGGGEYAGADCCLRKMLVSSLGTPFTFASCFAACGSGEDDCGLGVNSEDDFGLRRVFSILSGFDSVRSKGFFAFALCSLAGSRGRGGFAGRGTRRPPRRQSQFLHWRGSKESCQRQC